MEFINNFVDFIISFVESFGYLGVFLAVFLEYACLPLPSEVVLPFIGLIASRETISLLGVLFTSVLAGLLGSIVCYYIGYFGGAPILNYIQEKFPSSKKGFDKINHFIHKYEKSAVFIARLIPLTRTYVSLVVGSLRMKLLPFCMYSLGGIVLWNTILILLGYYLGENTELVHRLLSDYSMVAIGLAVIALLYYAYRKYKK